MTKKFLLVSATSFEVEPTLRFFGNASLIEGQHIGVAGTVLEFSAFDCLITGVGQLQCAAHLTSRLMQKQYQGVIQAGLGGSFSLKYPKGTVVRVVEEVLGDFGAEADGSFIDIQAMGLLPSGQFPFTDGVLRGDHIEVFGDFSLPHVRSVTVNRTLAEQRSIDWIKDTFSPDVVNMEGAALFYVCLLAAIPFVELRAVSDLVGPRNKATWDIPGAVEALNEQLVHLLQKVSDSGATKTREK